MRSKLSWLILGALMASTILTGCSSGADTAKNGVPVLPGDLQGVPGGGHGPAANATTPPAAK